MKTPLLVGAAFLVLAIPASASHSDLRSLTHDLDSVLAEARVDPANEAKIRALIQDAIRLAKNSSPVDSRCLDIATPAYEKHFQPNDALRFAGALCRDDLDADVLRVANAVYAKIYVPADALRFAAVLAKREDLRGKADLVELAYARYAANWQPTDALRFATNWAAKLPRGSEPCLSRALVTYEKSYQKSDALAYAAKFCAAK